MVEVERGRCISLVQTPREIQRMRTLTRGDALDESKKGNTVLRCKEDRLSIGRFRLERKGSSILRGGGLLSGTTLWEGRRKFLM